MVANMNDNILKIIIAIGSTIFGILVQKFWDSRVKKKTYISICTYEFTLPFIKPFRELYKYFFEEANRIGGGEIETAYTLLMEKSCLEVKNQLFKCELDSQFTYFSENISYIFDKVFSKNIYEIYNFIQRAKDIERTQKQIIQDLEIFIKDCNLGESQEENNQSEDGKNGTEKERILCPYKEKNAENIKMICACHQKDCRMDEYIKYKINEKNVKLVLSQIKGMQNAINELPEKLRINECIEQISPK